MKNSKKTFFLHKFLFLLLFSCSISCVSPVKAETRTDIAPKTIASVKTNLLSGAFLSPSLSLEFPLVNEQWTFEFTGEVCLWDAWDEQKWQHWTVSPAMRYWFKESFNQWSVDMHLLGGQLEFGPMNRNLPTFYGKMSDMFHFRYQGFFMGGGFGLGYDWQFSKHFSLAAEIGVGYIYMNTDKYRCYDERDLVRSDMGYHYFGPTKAEINIAYRFCKQSGKVRDLSPRREVVQAVPVEPLVAVKHEEPVEPISSPEIIAPVTVDTVESVINVIPDNLEILDLPIVQKSVPVIDEIHVNLIEDKPSFHPIFVYLGLDEDVVESPENNKQFCLSILNTVELNPDEESANLNAANIYMSQGNLSEARRYLGRAGYSKEAAYARGIYYALMGNYSESLASLRVAEEAKIKHASEMVEQIKALLPK